MRFLSVFIVGLHATFSFGNPDSFAPPRLEHPELPVVDERVSGHFVDPNAEPMLVNVVLAPVPFDDPSSRRAFVHAQQQGVLDAMAPGDFEIAYRYANFAALSVRVTREGYSTLLAQPEVGWIAFDETSRAQIDESIPFIGADLVHDIGFTGEGVTVAVLDTGIRTSHPDLSDSIAPGAWHFLGQGAQQGPGASDVHGHGTWVSGIITADGVVIGPGAAPDADILAVQVLDPMGEGYSSDIVAGIDYVISVADTFDPRPIINMSLGWGLFSACPCDTATPDVVLFSTALIAAWDAGISSVGASGNTASCFGMRRPACVSAMISVAQLTESLPFGTVVSTRQSDCNELAAPGFVTTTGIGGGTKTGSGTSFAAPHVSGVIALMVERAEQLGGTLGPQRIRDILYATAHDASNDCPDLPTPRTVDAFAAVSAVSFESFVRGDSDGNGTVEGIGDAIYSLSYLFTAGADLPCADAADFDGSGTVDLADAIATLQYSFLGGSPPSAPFPDCGPAVTLSGLGCDQGACP